MGARLKAVLENVSTVCLYRKFKIKPTKIIVDNILLGGQYPATRHRVVVPELEFRRKNLRQSIAFFVHPDDDVLCQPLSG